MKIKLKKGITMASLVIYIIVFSMITVVLSMIYTNMNETLFFNRGRSINYTTFNKLQYNINESTLASDLVMVSDGEIIFSNGDVYSYDADKKIILLNGGVLCSNISEFYTTSDTYNKKIEIKVKFNKYLNELEKTIISSIEVK